MGSHFCVVTGWNNYNRTLEQYAALLGVDVPNQSIAGGKPANGTYLGKPLLGTTKIAFLPLNEATQMEFLAGDPDHPNWWRDVYNKRGFEIHHFGFVLSQDIWPVVERFKESGLGDPVQWARWGNEHGPNKPGAGCYVYIDS